MNSYPLFFPRGGIHIDILREMSENLNAEEDHLTVDGHPNERGHALFTNLFAQQLSSGIVPALKPCCAGNGGHANRNRDECFASGKII